MMVIMPNKSISYYLYSGKPPELVPSGGKNGFYGAKRGWGRAFPGAGAIA
jgi:hypothetical protein